MIITGSEPPHRPRGCSRGCICRMEPGHSGVTGPETTAFDRLGLGQAVGHHQHLAGLHDGLDAHGVGLLGHQIFVAVKEALVGLDGGFGQIDAVGLQLKRIARLVEADVAVRAEAQQLQVDAAHAVDDVVVLLAQASAASGLVPSGR